MVRVSGMQLHFCAALLALAQVVLGHGYLSKPAARNINDR
jgi:predicted carbohydrate-binding protein with CBM5 and CBM33 domain